MNIALMAHDRKKELMVQFCIAYCGILAEHSLCATHVTGKLVSEATGLPITLYLHADQGGAQQIGARISFNEIDLVLFSATRPTPRALTTSTRSNASATSIRSPSPPTRQPRRFWCRACAAAISTGATSSIPRNAEQNKRPRIFGAAVNAAPNAVILRSYIYGKSYPAHALRLPGQSNIILWWWCKCKRWNYIYNEWWID